MTRIEAAACGAILCSLVLLELAHNPPPPPMVIVQPMPPDWQQWQGEVTFRRPSLPCADGVSITPERGSDGAWRLIAGADILPLTGDAAKKAYHRLLVELGCPGPLLA